MADRHDWLGWDQYISAHESRLADFEYFIVENHLVPTVTPSLVSWRGSLVCEDGIEIKVTKSQAVRHVSGRLLVRTDEYSYHAFRRTGDHTINLFRYDNIGEHGSPDRHHVHRYDANGVEITPPRPLSHAEWPTLGEVIDETCQWWQNWRASKSAPPR